MPAMAATAKAPSAAGQLVVHDGPVAREPLKDGAATVVLVRMTTVVHGHCRHLSTAVTLTSMVFAVKNPRRFAGGR